MLESFTPKIVKYLSEKVKGVKTSGRGDNILITCPRCLNPKPSATVIPGTAKLDCGACKHTLHMLDVVRIVEKEKTTNSLIEIASHLFNNYDMRFSEFELSYFLDRYEEFGFDLVPLMRNQKIPFEKAWLEKEHKKKEEWTAWLNQKLNIGVKTGAKSGITVIDIDTREIPKVLQELTTPTLVQVTPRGYHFVFKYEESLPTARIEEEHIDILNNGKQFVVYPSQTDLSDRTWNALKYGKFEIQTMPDSVKEWVLSKVKARPTTPTEQDVITKEVQTGELTNLDFISEGGRNQTLTKIGGILRKQLNMRQTGFVMEFMNKHFVKPSLNNRELQTIMGSLDKYANFDEAGLADKMIEYLRYAEEGTSKDIQEALGEPKQKVDKALSYLISEQIVVKRNRVYHLIKKATWRDTFPSIDAAVSFKMPYFDEVAKFNYGDMVLLGSKSKFGKTTVSMNILKSFVDQGIKPYYICLETGSRFITTAASLGMKEGDFFWDIQTDPTKIELEPNAVTVLDWLLIKDKAQTDTVMQYFVEQLVRTNGFLIMFQQCKEDGHWFAENMVKQFPAFAARYLYDQEDDGSRGAWYIDAIRDPKKNVKRYTIPCQYNFDTKILSPVSEINTYSRPQEEPKEIAL